MSVITKARAYANNAVAFVAWEAPTLPPGCVGFELARIDGAGQARVLAAWVPFQGQRNKDWKPQDTSVWPVQKFSWRDLTVRRRRDQATLRDQATYSYRIRPLALRGQGTQPVVPANPVTYQGPVIALDYIDEGITTAPVAVTTSHGPMSVAFNNGILSTQWLSRALNTPAGKPVSRSALMREIGDPASQIRRYLACDMPLMFQTMFDRLRKGGTLYLALYELTDPVLTQLILSNAKQVRLILANTGQSQASGRWDEENQPQRKALRAAGLAEMLDRFFNNAQHIGHNKFMVYVDGKNKPQAVLSGSTNWTPNGLCAQSNNAFIAELPALAAQYLDYWQRLKQDTAAFRPPASPGASTGNAQGAALRTANRAGVQAVPMGPTPVKDGAVRLWAAPNTPQVNKPAKAPLPPDLGEVFGYIQGAKRAVFFAVFLPSMGGQDSVISAAIEAAQKNPGLMVYGVISSPMAFPVPGGVAAADTGEGKDTAATAAQPAVFEQGNVHIIRPDALTVNDLVGDFQQELLSAGNAIVHDKIVVVDPTDAQGCVVVTGSHNLGYKASYANDDNIAIVRNNAAVAQAYMVHVLDLYDHYRFRAVQDQRTQGGKHDAVRWDGFLHADGQWQAKYPGGRSALSAYLAG